MSSQIAVFLRGMEESGLVSDVLEKTHLIGFSLGAHVAGFAGSELKNISRITGGRGRMDFNTIFYNYGDVEDFPNFLYLPLRICLCKVYQV